MDDQLTIREVSKRTGLSEHNLRYYERIGLIMPIDRNPSSRHRRYASNAIGWVAFLRCMRSTGMPLVQMRRYADLVQAGASTAGERRQMLVDHKHTVEARIAELQTIIGIIDKKIEYHEVLEDAGEQNDVTRRILEELEAMHQEEGLGIR